MRGSVTRVGVNRQDGWMRYEAALRHLQIVVDACARHAKICAAMEEEPLVVSAHAFGEVLRGPDRLDHSKLAFVLDLPAEKVTWYVEPREAFHFADSMRINRYPLEYYWRPAAWPAWNHYIRDPVELWSVERGTTGVVQALAERRFDALMRALPSPEDEARQREVELAMSERRLRKVLDSYWDQRWRRAHRYFGTYPEDHLWRATYGYLDVLGWRPGPG